MRSAIKCLKCGDVVVSRHRHDFRWCKCETVAIDGGRDYTRVCGNPEDYKIIQVKDSEGI